MSKLLDAYLNRSLTNKIKISLVEIPKICRKIIFDSSWTDFVHTRTHMMCAENSLYSIILPFAGFSKRMSRQHFQDT